MNTIGPIDIYAQYRGREDDDISAPTPKALTVNQFSKNDFEVAEDNKKIISRISVEGGPAPKDSFRLSDVHTMGVQKDGRLYVVLKSDGFFTRFFANVACFFGRVNTNIEAINKAVNKTETVLNILQNGNVDRDVVRKMDVAVYDAIIGARKEAAEATEAAAAAAKLAKLDAKITKYQEAIEKHNASKFTRTSVEPDFEVDGDADVISQAEQILAGLKQAVAENNKNALGFNLIKV